MDSVTRASTPYFGEFSISNPSMVQLLTVALKFSTSRMLLCLFFGPGEFRMTFAPVLLFRVLPAVARPEFSMRADVCPCANHDHIARSHVLHRMLQRRPRER